MFRYFVVLFYLSLSVSSQTTLLPIKANHRWGAIDQTGKVIIPTEFEFIGEFQGRGFALAQQNKRLGVIDRQGKVIVPFEYFNIQILTDSLLAVFNHQKKVWYIADWQGAQVAQEEFEEVKLRYNPYSTLREAVFIQVRQKGKLGALNKQGKMICLPFVDKIDFLKEDLMLFAVKKIINQKAVTQFGVFNLKGEEKLFHEYDNINYKAHLKPDSSFIHLRKKGKSGLADRFGTVLIEAEMDKIIFTGKGVEIRKDGKMGYLNEKFEYVISPNYNLITKCENGWYIVQKGSLSGLCNPEGKEVLETAYSAISTHSPTTFTIEKDNKYGVFFTEKQKIAIPVVHGSIQVIVGSTAQNPFFLLQDGNNWSVVDLNGKHKIRSGEYDEINFDEKTNIFYLRSGHHWGFTGELGNLAPRFEQVSAFQRNLALVKNGGKFGLVNVFGQVIGGAIYTKIRMAGNTARLTDAHNQTEYVAFNPDGTVLDRYMIGQVRSLKVNKAQVEEKEETWDFSFEGKRQTTNRVGQVVSRQANDRTRSSRKPETYQDIGLREVSETKKIFDKEKRDSVKSVFWGLIDTQTNEYILKPLREYPVQDLVRDFRQGEVARMAMQYLRRNGQAINAIKEKTKTGIAQNKFIFFTMPFERTHLSRFNVGGSPRNTITKIVITEQDVLGGKWGLMNRKGEVNLMPEYDELKALDNVGFMKMQKGSGKGILDSLGKVIIPPLYTQVDYLENTQNKYFLLTKRAVRYGFLDSTAQVCIDLQFQKVGDFHEGRAMVGKDSLVSYQVGKSEVKRQEIRYTFIDTKGELIHPFAFQAVRDFSEGLAAVKLDNRWGYINAQGQIVIKPQFTQAGDFHEGRAWIRQSREEGFRYIDSEGNIKTEIQFSEAKNYQFGVAIAREVATGKVGLLNTDGSWRVKPQYQTIREFSPQGYAEYKTKAGVNIGLLHHSGKEITPAQYRDFTAFVEGFAVVRGDKGYNLMDSTGNFVSQRWFDEVIAFNEGLAPVKSGKLWGYINPQGDYKIKPQFTEASAFFEYIALVRDTQGSYYIDTLGNRVDTSKPDTLPYSPTALRDWVNVSNAEETLPRSQGMIAFKRNGLWGFIKDTLEKADSRILVSPRYHEVTPFYNGFARVRWRNNVSYLDVQGRGFNKLPNKTKWMDLRYPLYQIVKENDRYGFANRHNFMISEPKFSYLSEMKENYTAVGVTYLQGIADLSGNIILAPEYEVIRYMGDGVFRLEKNDRIGYWHLEKGWIWNLKR
jgi:hypothetical protein